jgi:hypothetical protein
MDRDEQIRAKALEIAAITLGSFPPAEEERDDVPAVYVVRAEAVERYIRAGKPATH